jgi:two-component sensor histidine kinase
VALRQEQAQVELTVADRGPGLPAGFDPDRSLGLKIARALTADQLRGELMLEDASPGVRARLTWSVA